MTKHEDLVCVHAPGNKDLRDLLKAWTRMVMRYCVLHDYEDNPWWANERASISVLAGAAWSMEGWCALEEFSTKKRGAEPSDKVEEGGLKHGRCDLYVGNKRTSYVFEAKQAWQTIGPKADGCRHLVKGMKMAWKDIKRTDSEEAHHRYAATFIIPSVPETLVGEFGDGARKLLSDWLAPDDIKSMSKRPLIYAYVFPGKGEGFVSDLNAKAFPGVLLVLEERLRS